MARNPVMQRGTMDDVHLVRSTFRTSDPRMITCDTASAEG